MKPDTQKCEKYRKTKSRRLGEEKRQTLTGRHLRQERENPITGYKIRRAFSQDMEHQKANPTTAANRRSFYEPSNNRVQDEYDQYGDRTSKLLAATPLGKRGPWTKGRFQLTQLIAIRNTLVPTGQPGDKEGTANRGNVALKG